MRRGGNQPQPSIAISITGSWLANSKLLLPIFQCFLGVPPAVLRLMAIPLKDIKKYLFYPLVQARVCRVWMPKQNGQTSSFNCLLVDHQGGAI